MLLPRLLPVLFLPAVLAFAASSASLVFEDDFANGRITDSVSRPGFWKIQTQPQSDNGVFERDGRLILLAAGRPYTYACLNTAVTPELHFFSRPLTFEVEGFNLEGTGVPTNEVVFRLSLNPTELRQNNAAHSLTLRLTPNLALLGFKVNQIGGVDAENMHGQDRRSVCYQRFDGTLTGFSLSLVPMPQLGAVTYTLTLRTTGAQPVLTRTGQMVIDAPDWIQSGRTALVLEARRNTDTSDADSFVLASLGHLRVTTVLP